MISGCAPSLMCLPDFHAFGMVMIGRTFSGNGIGDADYRYDFNGKENDKQSGLNHTNFGMRMYDARLSRFMSKDPVAKFIVNKSPYNFAGNSPILFADHAGGFQVIPGVSASGAKLKTLQLIARAVSNIANKNPTLSNPFIRTFIEQTGLPMDESGLDIALQTLSYGSGPVVIASNDPRITKKSGRNVAGKYFNSCDMPFVFINDALLDNATDGKEGHAQGILEAKIISLITLWHEGGHYVDYEIDGVRSPGSDGYDIMDQAENCLFGFQPSFTNLDGYIKGRPTEPLPSPSDDQFYLGDRQSIFRFWNEATKNFLIEGQHTNLKGYTLDINATLQIGRQISDFFRNFNYSSSQRGGGTDGGSHGEVRGLSDVPNSGGGE